MVRRKSMRGMGADVFFETPVRQQDGIPAYQHAVKTADQHTSTATVGLVKATFYLTPEHVMQLERLRLSRKQQGQKVDKSALVREAIELLTKRHGDQ